MSSTVTISAAGAHASAAATDRVPASKAGAKGYLILSQILTYVQTALASVYAAIGTTISAAGLATGGGSLAANRTITVTAATDAQARAQTATTVALTPANLAGRATFGANKGGVDQTGIAAATWTKVTTTTEEWDVGAAYDNTNSRWTPPASVVRISAKVLVSAGVSALGEVACAIYKNGTALRYGVHEISAAGTGAQVSVVMCDLANGTDYYELFIYGVSAGTLTINGASVHTYIAGEQI